MKYWMKSSETNMSDALSRKLNDRNQAAAGDNQERACRRLLIIGYGNPLRGDDAIGWQIADQLAKVAGNSTRVLAVHQLTPELAEAIAEADLVIFIDARYDGQPGIWTCETIRPDSTGSDAYTHYFTPVNLLNYASAVFDANPTALLISVAGSSFDCSETLSPAVAAAVPEIVACICEWWNAETEKTHA